MHLALKLPHFLTPVVDLAHPKGLLKFLIEERAPRARLPERFVFGTLTLGRAVSNLYTGQRNLHGRGAK